MVQFGFNVKRLVTILIVPVKKDKDVQLLSDILDLHVHQVFKLDPRRPTDFFYRFELIANVNRSCKI